MGIELGEVKWEGLGELAFHLPSIVFPGCGYPRESHGRIATWLRQAICNGFIDRGDVPREWLNAWGCYLDRELEANRGAAEPKPASAAA